ncbi:2-dehydropantoate 2-reductase [bacterium]|nr:2-dehydropantoate 2-reductase [bacterium]MCI0606908.1 2-dehydropantoate 2-reductase [bacterium]
MKIAVYGSGGVGGYFGGQLALAGEQVYFIARGAHLQAIRENGLEVASNKGDFRILHALAAERPSEIGPVDIVLVAVKAWQVPEIAPTLEPLLGPDTFVVPLENGVESADQLVSVIGKDRVVGGLCKIISYIEGPGKIKHAGAEPFIAFGELDNRKSERTQKLLASFKRVGVASKIPEDIHAAIWEKFLFIASISGIGAVTRSSIGILRTLPETRAMLEEAMQEIYSVAIAKRIPLKDNVIAKTMSFVDQLPASGTASMQRDLAEGKPSELDAQNGAVVRFGKEKNVPTPVHAFIYHCLLPSELKARGKI